METKAYRCLVDRERFAIVQGVDVVQARERFGTMFPDRPFVAMPIAFWASPGDPEIQVINRTCPLR